MKAIKWLDDHFEESLLVILLVVIFSVSLIQVIIRNIPQLAALQWAEEFCRFCWIWSVFLSLPYTIRKGSMLRVSVLLDLVPGTLRKVVNILVDLIVTASMGFLTVYSVSVLKDVLKSGEASPAMLWPMWIVYIVMLIGFALGTVRGLQQAIIHMIHFHEKELTTLEQTIKDAAEEAAMAKGEEGENE